MILQNFKRIHVGLIRFIRIEIKKNKGIRKKIIFLFEAGKAYFKALFQWYKTLFLVFDVDYQKQKKQYEKYNQLKTDLNRALKMLKYIDNKMAKDGISRQARRQFWRDFFARGEIRKDIFEDLTKELK